MTTRLIIYTILLASGYAIDIFADVFEGCPIYSRRFHEANLTKSALKFVKVILVLNTVHILVERLLFAFCTERLVAFSAVYTLVLMFPVKFSSTWAGDLNLQIEEIFQLIHSEAIVFNFSSNLWDYLNFLPLWHNKQVP
jgi:hypothetical protein